MENCYSREHLFTFSTFSRYIKEIESYIYDTDDANIDLNRRVNIRSRHRHTFKLTVVGVPFTFSLGDIVLIKHDRFEFNETTGKYALIIGMVERPNVNQVDLEVWF